MFKTSLQLGRVVRKQQSGLDVEVDGLLIWRLRQIGGFVAFSSMRLASITQRFENILHDH